MNPSYKTLAEDFAQNVAAARFVSAHALLLPGTQAKTPPEKLAAEFASITAYGEGEPATFIQALQYSEDWPAKEPGDLAWIYVAIAAESYSEAVAVVVAKEPTMVGIRTIEWGKP